METQEDGARQILHLFIKPTFKGASEMTYATSDEAILFVIGYNTQELEVELGESFEVPLECEAEYDEMLRIYSEEHGDLYDDPFEAPVTLSAGRYVFEGDAIRVLEQYPDKDDDV